MEQMCWYSKMHCKKVNLDISNNCVSLTLQLVCYVSIISDNSLYFSDPSAPPGWLSGERAGLMTWWSWRTFFPAYPRLSPLQKHVRKVVCNFGKKSCVSTGVRKPENTCTSLTAII